MAPSPDSGRPIDWSLTTWAGSRREQLRRWAELPLDRVVLALEEMQELAGALGAPAPPAAGPEAPEGDGPGRLGPRLRGALLPARAADSISPRATARSRPRRRGGKR
jgi:hypothetical protein